MKKSLRLISIVLSIVMLLTISACKKGIDKKPITEWHSVSKDGVTVSVKTDKESYEIGEYILLYYKIENTRSSPIYQCSDSDENFEFRADIELDGKTIYSDAGKSIEWISTLPVIESNRAMENKRLILCRDIVEKNEIPSGKYNLVFKTARYTYVHPDEQKVDEEEWIEQEISLPVKLTEAVEHHTEESSSINWDEYFQDDVKYDLK